MFTGCRNNPVLGPDTDFDFDLDFDWDWLASSRALIPCQGQPDCSDADKQDLRRIVLDIARSSALKSLVLTDVLSARDCLSPAEAQQAKTTLGRIVKMLWGMRGYLQE